MWRKCFSFFWEKKKRSKQEWPADIIISSYLWGSTVFETGADIPALGEVSIHSLSRQIGLASRVSEAWQTLQVSEADGPVGTV